MGGSTFGVLVRKACGGPVRLGCPYDCGPCAFHEGSCNLPVFSVTNACDLRCPICFTYNREDKPSLSKVFLPAGVGPLGFSFLRGILFKWYSHNLVWMIFWEEFTELLMVAAVIVVLWVMVGDFKSESLRRIRALLHVKDTLSRPPDSNRRPAEE